MPGRISPRTRLCLRPIETYRHSQCRSYSTQKALTHDIGPIQRDEDSHRSFRLRQYGPPLPLPPALDPIISSARSQWQEPKQKPNVAEFTPFQKKLWENPYAHTLASPLRICRSTSVLVPTPLLTTLHPRPHPVTKAPWLLPVSLTTSQHHLGTPHRFLAHKFLASYISHSRRNWERSVPARMDDKLGRTENLVLREDMADLIHTLLQKQLIKKLKWHFSQRGQLTPCTSPHTSHIDGIDDVSSILYLGTLKHLEELTTRLNRITQTLDRFTDYTWRHFENVIEPHKQKGVTHRAPSWYKPWRWMKMQPRLQYPPLEYPMTMWRGRKVAVYSLVDLLGEEGVKELVAGTVYEGEKCLVVKRARHNVPVEMLLMGLTGYLAEPGV
ncbi:hypothetical protein DM02DRAFT_612385 [Periconia macrospinosa]|uniref:Uncharacterized protein n=1 Tax=Periconia macrospinosa TaxID=97972 RepID=A0A2V1E2C0_9PLEO|nr:hypothetical protein DM02DRAFT_612385 [Periconia macrospinosa]